jgi:molybdopterin-containing oxidoreductase family iron-sulfur binding subunit
MAVPQGSMTIDLSVRPLLPYAKLSEVKANPKAGTERPKGDWSIWPGHAYPETRWGMSVDLSKCIGCGACTIACQAENNIPTAGKKGVIRGREMHWLRVDRYHRMPVPRTAKTREAVATAAEARKRAEENLDWLDEPEVIFHPLMCQHCENAPCETVCPVGATNHSSDGLNVQAYNRCVGTRYCSNNCPFKARRFNWFDYSKDRSSWLTRILEPALTQIANMNVRWPLPLKNNPEVTVRSRGVMEKCTFCVQRIEKGRGRAKDENRKIRDGDVVPACMQTCPTQAIRFGNLVDSESEVAKLRSGPRALTMLDEQKLGTSVTYLTKVRNDEG